MVVDFQHVNVVDVFSVAAGVLRQLNESRSKLEDLWAARKLKLDLCLQLRLFERDALEVSIAKGLWPVSCVILEFV